MPRPQVIVRIAAALARRGAPTATGPAFFAFADPDDTKPLGPVVCRSQADATAAFGNAQIAQWTGDALNEGVPEVTLVRVDAADAAAVTDETWTAALDKLTSSLGPGQVAIPGVATVAAATALVDHAGTTGRTALVDAPQTPTRAELLAQQAAVTGPGAISSSTFGPWVPVPAPGGVLRNVPASVIVAGLIARGDAAVGHANHAPAGDQGRGAGTSRLGDKRGLGVTTTFSDADWDALADAGVNLIVPTPDGPQLQGFRSASDDDAFRQLNVGRLVMQLRAGIRDRMLRYHFRQIDGENKLYAEVEGALRGYLQPLYEAAALYGATADEAYDVEVAAVNTAEDAAAGRVVSAVEISPSRHTESLVIDVLTYLPGERAA